MSNREALHPVDRRDVIIWEAVALLFIVIAASALHFLYELSGFRPWATLFGSVNESTLST